MDKPDFTEPRVYNKSDLTYQDYLKVPELTGLQHLQSEHHDEMLFIIIHQTYELWFKQILHELTAAMKTLDAGEVLRTRHYIARVVEILKLGISQIHLLETMAPVEFLQFRDILNPASGFQSMQFREVEFMLGLKDERYLHFFKNRPDLCSILQKRLQQRDFRTAFHEMIEKLGENVPKGSAEKEPTGDNASRVALLGALQGIYQKPEANLPLYLLCESLIELDETLRLWRIHHVTVVERIIGFKKGTGGSSGVGYLRSTIDKQVFPLLWEVRTQLEKTED